MLQLIQLNAWLDENNLNAAPIFFDVKEAATGAKYLIINESKKVGKSHEHNRIMIFEEDLQSFSEGLQKVAGFIQK